MIIIDRLSFPSQHQPQVGDLFEITKLEVNGRGRWTWKVRLVEKEKVQYIYSKGEELHLLI